MYTFLAHRDGSDWFLQCDEVAGAEATVHRLTAAHETARKALAARGIAVDDDDVVISVQMPSRAEGHLAAARELEEQVRELTERAVDELARGVQQLRKDGLTQREISLALGLSVTRVRQLDEYESEDEVPLTAAMMEHLYTSGALPRR